MRADDPYQYTVRARRAYDHERPRLPALSVDEGGMGAAVETSHQVRLFDAIVAGHAGTGRFDVVRFYVFDPVWQRGSRRASRRTDSVYLCFGTASERRPARGRAWPWLAEDSRAAVEAALRSPR
jgi:hypothetical protein